MAVCLVTGGAGFIGSHLAEALVARGDQVRVFDNFSTGLLANLDKVRCDVEMYFGEVAHRELLLQAAQGVEVLFHFASPRGAVDDAGGDPKWAQEAETVHVLNAARSAGVRRVICASSCSVYGQTDAPRVSEDDAILPTSPYGFAKFAGEMHCLGFTSLYGLETVRLRYSNVFGPRQCPTSCYAQELPIIVKSMLLGQTPILGESAALPRDLVYIDDAVHATLLAANMPRVSGQAYNIASGRAVDLFEVLATVNGIIGGKIPPACQGTRACHSALGALDITRAETELGYCPGVDLQQGLRLLIEYYAQQGGFPLAEQVAAERRARGPHRRAVQPTAALKPIEPEPPRPN